MIPWVLLDKVKLLGEGKELRLYQRDSEYSIKVGAYQLMNSRIHNSEDALAQLACAKLSKNTEQRVLIGGLGMGFTLREALNHLKAQAQITVAELVPEVVEWNKTFLEHLAKKPLKDKRVTVYVGDVADKIKAEHNSYHAILLDVDNGAQGLTQDKNDAIYSVRGLRAAYTALQRDGVLAIWSACSDDRFKKRLQKAHFSVEEVRVRARSGPKGGGESIVWVATKRP